MRVMFPIGIKIKKFNNKININAQVQSIFDKEINKFYLPLTKEPFEEKKTKRKSIKKTKERKETKETKETKESKHKTKKHLTII